MSERIEVAELTDAEVEAAAALEPGERYERFLAEVSRSGFVWVLAHATKLALVGHLDGTPYVPVWPHPRHADAERCGGWADYEPTGIALDDWLVAALEALAGDGIAIGVFPVFENGAWLVDSDELAADLRAVHPS